MDFKKELSLFDLTNIVVGSVIGADILYRVRNNGGVTRALFPCCVGYCRRFCDDNSPCFCVLQLLYPESRGPFAYVSAAFDDFFGFLTGWSMWIAELISLPVFCYRVCALP